MLGLHIHKFGAVTARHQSCGICGYTRIVGCAHTWGIIKDGQLTRSSTGACIGYLLVLQCKHCGEIKNHAVTI